MVWLATLGTRAKIWLGVAAALVAAFFAAYFSGRRHATDAMRSRAAEREQSLRRAGDAAAADAERSGAERRLRDGRF